jgi:hypothetical protein
MKFHKDVLLIGEEKVSLTVFNADDNSVIYSEERALVDEENDVNHLVAHLLTKVQTERERTAKAAAQRKAAELRTAKKQLAAVTHDERDLKALNDAQFVLTFYSSSDTLVEAILEANRNNPNPYHVYLDDTSSRAEADIVLEEKIQRETYTLTLATSDTSEILHIEVVPANSRKRAIIAMSKWITSRGWE